MARILVTGCAGFIGSHLCEQLLSLGHAVVGIDNFSSFYPRKIKEENLSGFIKHPNFLFHEVDIRNKQELFDSIDQRIDLVAHLAAKAGVRPSIKDPEAYIDVNVKGSNNILELMRRLNCKRMFFASSSSIYGNQKITPFKEEGAGLRPISPYAFTKRSCELMTYTYHHLYGFDVINARFFTVYGPRQRPDLAIHKFVKMSMEGQPIPMFGDGTTSRDYTFIDDIIDGVVGAIDYLLEEKGVYETINLGNNHPVQLSELIALIFKITGAEEKTDRLPPQEGDVNITYADITRASELIGYAPKTNLEDGIKSFISWYNKVLLPLAP